MKPFVIRTAKPGDIPAIFAMIAELAEFEKLSHLLVVDEAMLHDAFFGERPSCESLIGEQDGLPVAYALFFHNFSTFLGRKGLYLEDLYVKPEYRGKGYAKEMLTQLARLAIERGCGRFEWSVLDWNENAIRFYQSLGADVLPDWRICRLTGPGLVQLAG
jgi:GNAT superfamily N-acetyltransferase